MPAALHPDRRAAWLDFSAGAASIVVALLLVGLKLWALAQTGALSVAASLADSALDVMMSLGALAALVYAARPADEDHSFGHSSVEDLAALGQALFVLAAAGAIGVAAAGRLISPSAAPAVQAHGTGIGIMAASLMLTLALVGWQTRVARKTASRVVAADRLHYLGDLVPNLGAIVALALARDPRFAAADAVIALGGAGMLALGALHIGRGAWDALMDRRADPALIADIGQMAADWPQVYGYHDLKTRTAGRRVFVHLHIELDGAQSLTSAHDIGAALRRAIMQRYPHCDVIIHKDVYHPAAARADLDQSQA